MNLRNILYDNWHIKLLSLFLAVALWFYVTSKGKTEITLAVPLELRNTPQNMAVVGNVTGYIDVRLLGQERSLRDITTGKKVSGVLDLSMAKTGENTVRISPDDIRRPSGVAVTYITPSEVKVKLEPLMRKVFRLRPILHGAPAPGYHITGLKVEPAQITVEGPVSALSPFNKLQTMPIDIQDAKESLVVDPKIDYQGQSLRIVEQRIAVVITIERMKK